MNFYGAGNNALSCLSMRCTSFVSCLAHRGDKSTERPSEGGSEGIEKVLAAVGLGGAAQPTPVCRGMLSRDLFESPNGAQSRRISTANGRKCITPASEALVHEKSMAEGDRTHRSKISRIRSLPLVHETATSKSRSRSRLLPQYRRGVQEVVMRRRKR